MISIFTTVISYDNIKIWIYLKHLHILLLKIGECIANTMRYICEVYIWTDNTKEKKKTLNGYTKTLVVPKKKARIWIDK